MRYALIVLVALGVADNFGFLWGFPTIVLIYSWLEFLYPTVRGQPVPNKLEYDKPREGFGPDDDEKERKRFYNGKPWRKLRLAFLKANPLCGRCKVNGLVVEATTVHHVIERLDAPELSLTWSNLESLCPACHTAHHTTQRRIRATTPSPRENDDGPGDQTSNLPAPARDPQGPGS